MFETPLRVALVLGGLGFCLELLVIFFRSKLVRRVIYFSVFIVTIFAAVIILAADLRLGTVLVALVALYRSVNAMRVVAARTKEIRLRPASKRTSVHLLLYQLVAVGLWRLGVELEVGVWEVLYLLTISSLAIAIVILIATVRNLKRTLVRPSDKYTPDTDLPTVSVCIPARNETIDLPSCLASVLKSDYPKLEVLVLDDCSQDQTSEIIKGFAQQGVRFIQGEEPKDGWLAKNQAYQVLAEAASGEVLLFCGVDVRFEKTTIRSMVGSLIARKKQMISVLPRGLQIREHAGFIQPMRYWWELALPRRLFNRPPVLSTVWMITRQALFGLGELKAVRGSVLPEGFFARELTKSDEYSFMRASGKLMVSTVKQFADQWETALRTRYPEARKRPENVFLLTVAELWTLCLPIGLFFVGFFTQLYIVWLLAGINTLILLYVHYRIVQAWGIKSVGLPLAVFPAAVLIELALLQISMWKFEFSEITWKDRNICIPVMRYHKSLPPV